MPPGQKKSRNTKQLEVIWAAIKDDNSHPTADQVYEKVRKKIPNVSLGTVYRNLQKLVVDEKLQVLTQGRLQRFDPLTARHQHFICERCNRVYDVLVEQQNEIKPVKLPHAGFKVTSHQVAFYGTCKHCSS
jgi:Fur family transcriptional regulator, peroxide stress response regulator